MITVFYLIEYVNNNKAPVLLCYIGPPNKEAMIERMKTTEVTIKDG